MEGQGRRRLVEIRRGEDGVEAASSSMRGRLRASLSSFKPSGMAYAHNCRNNTAMFSIITGDVEWRFHYSQTGGEFSQMCFKVLNSCVNRFRSP